MSLVEEDEHQVARARDRVEEADRRLLAELQVLAHALAGVEEHAEVERELLALLGARRRREQLERCGRPSSSTSKSSASRRSETRSPLRVAHRDRDVDEVEARPRKTGGALGRAAATASEDGDGQRHERRSESRDALTPGSLPQDLDDPHRQVHLVEGRHDVDALRQLARGERRLLRDRHALGCARSPEPASRMRSRMSSGMLMPGHLVVQELGVPVRVERQDARPAPARRGA